jgi:hypothetical protein
MIDTLGRVLILCEAGEECALISRLVAPDAATCRTSFPAPSEDVPWTAVVLVAPSCRSPLAREGVLEALRRRMGDRTVLVTRFCPDNARGLAQLPPVRVVWLERVEEELPDILARLAARRPTRQIHALFREHLPPGCSGLHPVLDAAFLGHTVPGSVRELAYAAGMGARRVRDLWKAAGLPHRPEALVDLGLLGRVLDVRGGGGGSQPEPSLLSPGCGPQEGAAGGLPAGGQGPRSPGHTPSSLGRKARAGRTLATSAITMPHFCH